jgi:Cu+-exporting ATPase
MIPVAMGLFKSFGISINPMLASLAMVLSSITVILNTLRLRRIKNT